MSSPGDYSVLMLSWRGKIPWKGGHNRRYTTEGRRVGQMRSGGRRTTENRIKGLKELGQYKKARKGSGKGRRGARIE